jgi:magnesium-protoporphyrin IX monomethyl ester (oxidative) cyclase
MPFASLAISSLAITQLKAAAGRRFGDRIEVENLYLNHDFALWLGDLDLYRHALSNQGFMTGIGDWFFRQSAFPSSGYNMEEYLDRYYNRTDPATEKIRSLVIEKRAGVDALLDELIRKYGLADAGVVGLTALFAQTVASFAMARRLKAANPDIVVIMGGAACTGEMGQEFARQLDTVDFFFSGPGLVSFPRFVEHYLSGDMESCSRINGVFAGAGRVGKKPGAGTGAVSLLGDECDINENIKLDYGPFLDSVERAFPNGGIEPLLLFETSRGCWWGERQRCSFCGLNGPMLHFRPMSPENAIEQMESLFKYSPRCSFVESVDTILPQNYIKEVFPSLCPPAGMKVQYEVRTHLREADLKVLCDAGVTVLQPGIESLSSATLKLMRKGVTAFQNLQFLKACSKFPVTMGWNLLIFSPRESEDTYERYLRNIPLFTHLHPPQWACMVGFVRYSHYFEHASEYGLDLQPEDHYFLTYPFDDVAVSRVATKFRDAAADNQRMESWLGRLNEAVARWRARWLNQDNQLESRLCLLRDGNADMVYDSRNGTANQYPISEMTRKILEFLEQPRKPGDFAAGFPEWPDLDAEKEISFLRERGLLFEEDGKFLSLVII